MKIVKNILTVVGVLALAFVALMIFADDPEPTTPGTSQTKESGSEVKSGVSSDDETRYTLILEDGSEVDILMPQTILDDEYVNMNEQRKESIFSSIYNYDHSEDVYVVRVPDDEQTLKEMLKEPYAVGSIFNFDAKVAGGPDFTGRLHGSILGDDSAGPIYIDMSYVGDEKHDLMTNDVASFYVVYAGLTDTSMPTFIALDMYLQ